ncbi:DUF3040 domain-containing protein [Streptomyces actuosus]|uniref:DUF3040 domain-containing protein n=1 Tax=Streptomyces actuosus TaxID=1885 RepID=A0ABS2W0V4_STRAS|nr:DUF3040 domain-containing protein [Streptomyces actuosus]
MDDGAALSPHERKILADIEQRLQADVELQRTLRSRPRLRVIARRSLAAGVLCTLAALRFPVRRTAYGVRRRCGIRRGAVSAAEGAGESARRSAVCRRPDGAAS